MKIHWTGQLCGTFWARLKFVGQSEFGCNVEHPGHGEATQLHQPDMRRKRLRTWLLLARHVIASRRMALTGYLLCTTKIGPRLTAPEGTFEIFEA